MVVETDIKTDDEKANLDVLGESMGDMAPAEFEDKAEPPALDDKSPQAAPEDGGDPPAEDPPPVEAPADKPAGDDPPAVKAEDAPDPGPSEEEEVQALAGPLTHDQVSQSPSFRGLLSETATTRAENKILKQRVAELEANVIPPSGEADQPGELFEEEEDDDDIETMTKGERKAMMADAIKTAVAQELAPLRAERQAGDSLTNVQNDIAAMQADPAIPDGLKLSRVCIDARKHMAANSPELLKSIDGKPGMSRELYNYGVLRVPSVRSVVARASSTQTADATQRALRGQETTDEPKEFFEMLGFTEGDDVPEPTE